MLPYNRYDLVQRKELSDLRMMEGSEFGWYFLLAMLRTEQLYRYDLFTSKSATSPESHAVLSEAWPPVAGVVCSSPDVSFADVLRTLLAEPGAGFDRAIHPDEMTLRGYLSRVAAILDAVDSENVDGYLCMLDPQETVQPIDLFCFSKWGDTPAPPPQQPAVPPGGDSIPSSKEVLDEGPAPADRPPEILTVALPDHVQPGGQFSVLVEARDDRKLDRVVVRCGRQERTLSGAGAPRTLGRVQLVAPSSPGSATVRVTAWDSAGQKTVVERSVRVRPRREPRRPGSQK